jgi:hypothetical protein
MVAAAAPVNFVPIDSVARDAVAVGLAETSHRIFHLTNDSPPRVGETLDHVFAELGLAPPRHVGSVKAFTTLDQTLHDHLGFYSSYMNSDKIFSRANTDAVVGAGAGRCPLPMPRMREIARWYLDRLARQAQARQARVVRTAAFEEAS